ncbi:hypothetical protein Krad_2386 [Kineococcus radiotolerans SRS30216 = ATCC BAA-149]|uniref:Uncharacterized protein n=1 Tax=Kineococcus radiotolerans (strain ATCC BAA-149 / DSM 14245 / SRS30216) TaxID=266940 RepID=A6WAM7_KINRD|nr:hypothetical protein Krad_2386 [Kineococcus radiotolerans SRS30216 = ATCC BAA-149]
MTQKTAPKSRAANQPRPRGRWPHQERRRPGDLFASALTDSTERAPPNNTQITHVTPASCYTQRTGAVICLGRYTLGPKTPALHGHPAVCAVTVGG